MRQKLVAIYTRVSTEEQVRKGTSIDSQREALRNYCNDSNYKIYKEYNDKGFSGSNVKRPELQNLLKDAKDKKFDLMVVTKTDRLSRNVRDIVRIVLDYLEELKIEFKAIHEPYETTTKTGRLFFTLLAGFADFERETIRERTMSGRQRRAQEGKNPGFGIALGYKIKNGKFVIDEYYAPVVKEIYKLFIEGNTFFKIASILNEKGIKAQKSKKWRDVTINKILKNVRYTGVARVNLGGMTYDIKELIPPIIDKETFEKAQGRRTLPKKLGPTTKPKYLLSGKDLMVCKYCGSGLVHVNKKYRDKNGKICYATPYYHDNNRTFGVECGKLKSIRAERIEPLLIAIVKEVWLLKNFQKKFKEIYAENLESIVTKNELKTLDDQYVGLKRRKDNLLSAVEKGVEMSDLKERLDSLNSSIKKNRLRRENLMIHAEKALDILKSFESINKRYILKLHTKPIYTIRRVIELFIDKIIVDNVKIKVIWNEDIFSLLEGIPEQDTFFLMPSTTMHRPWDVSKDKKQQFKPEICAKCQKAQSSEDESYWWIEGKFYCRKCYREKLFYKGKKGNSR